MSITVQTRPDTLENTNLKEILTQDAYAYEEIQPNGNGMVETIDQYRLSGLTPQSIEQKKSNILNILSPPPWVSLFPRTLQRKTYNYVVSGQGVQDGKNVRIEVTVDFTDPKPITRASLGGRTLARGNVILRRTR